MAKFSFNEPGPRGRGFESRGQHLTLVRSLDTNTWHIFFAETDLKANMKVRANSSECLGAAAVELVILPVEPEASQ